MDDAHIQTGIRFTAVQVNLTHAPAPEPANSFSQKKDGEEVELNECHPGLREGDKGKVPITGQQRQAHA